MEPQNLFEQAFINFYGDASLRSEFKSMMVLLRQSELIPNDFSFELDVTNSHYTFLIRFWHAYKSELRNSWPKKYDREFLEEQALEKCDAEDVYDLRDNIETCSDEELMIIGQIFDEPVLVDSEDFVDQFFSVDIRWHIDDVKSLRPHLSDLQALEVLQQLKDYHNPEVGINFEAIRDLVNQKFNRK